MNWGEFVVLVFCATILAVFVVWFVTMLAVVITL